MARQRDDEQAPSRRMNISSRLVLLLVIPLTGLLAVTGFGVYSGATQANDAAGLGERTDLALSAFRLVDALQDERESLVAERATTAELQDAVQVASEDLARRAAAVGGRLETDTSTALRSVQASQRVAERELGGPVALRIYSSAVAQLLDVSTLAIDPAGAIDGAAASTAEYLARAQAASAEERDLVRLLVDTDALDAASFQEVMSLASAQRSYAELAAATAPPALALQIREVFFAMSAADTLRRDAFVDAADSDTWIEGLTQRTDELERLQRSAEGDAVAAVDDLARSSRLLLVVASLAAVASLLVSILLLRRATRSIARPLQDLAVQAEDVARTRLPEAVAAQQSRDGEDVRLPALRATGAAEVHDVAEAFNDVQDTALRLASEQAALRVNQSEALTNLGRRNQTLLARQLDFISSLEKRETDPAFLDHLFKLDHLASRMRRNAESLLILAGSETPRRRRRPAPISEIVRAAMSEVEEFERVRIGNVRDATIAGPAVIDLIHLLAELIENALGFSPPDTTVEIDGRSLGQGGYQFAIIDHGVGMTDVELVSANQRLRGLDELEGMPTRYLGQYVVAKLAAKTGAMVRLQPSSGGRGVTALVILPSTALVGAPDRDAVAQPLPGSRASREQGPVPYAPGTGVVPVTGLPVTQAAEAAPDAAPSIGADGGLAPSVTPVPPSEEAYDAPAPETTVPTPAPGAWWDLDAAEDTSTGEQRAADAELDTADAGTDTADAGTDTADAGNALDAADTGVVPPAPSLFGPNPFDEDAPAVDDVPGGVQEPDPVETDAETDAEVAVVADVEAGPADVGAGDAGAAEALAASLFGPPPAPMAEPPSTDAPSFAAPSDDPWRQFMGDGADDGADDGDAAVPPPAPPVAPVQPGWVPADAASAATPGPSMASDAAPTEPMAPFAAAQPFDAPQHADAPVAGAGPVFDAPEPSSGRAGGLTRRVPGQSLAESRGDQIGGGVGPQGDRSADGVRSMLSSFQAGRHRGRGAPDAGAGGTGSFPDSGTSVPTAHDSVHDGRSPQ